MKYNNLIDNKKKKEKINAETIKKIEERLSKLSKKTININISNEYTKIKLKMTESIGEINNAYYDYLKKLKWFAYINKRRHEDNLMNYLKKTYGKDAIFILGDWGNKGRLSFISTPNIGIKRELKKHFKVFHIDEYRTSKIHHKTEEKCKNYKYPFIKAKYNRVCLKYQKVHSIFTYKMSNGRLGCINRDINAVKNMKKITEELIKIKKRPLKYRRKKTL